jgi:hypothetical protein
LLARKRVESVPSRDSAIRTARIVGRGRSALGILLSEVLRELDVGLCDRDDVDLILALITHEDVAEVIPPHPRASVIAILPVGDERLAKRAIACGAAACWALDTSLDLLRALLRTVPTRGSETAWLPALGTRVRALLASLRTSGGDYPRHAIPRDAEPRLHRALLRDGNWASRLGTYARLEATLMRLDAEQVSELEAAIQADLLGP